jgi:CcmD family protein
MSDSGITYMYIGYTVIWLGWFLYLLYLHSKEARLEKDLKNLEEMVKRNDRKRRK